MKNFTFRIRFKLAQSCSISVDYPLAQITETESDKSLSLSSQTGEEPISQTRDLILKSSGWSSAQDAQKTGEQYRDALIVAFACLRIGADFGNRSPKSFITPSGVTMLEQHFGGRVLNDEHGLSVFESEPTPSFASVDLDSFVITTKWNCFEETFRQVVDCKPHLSDQHRLALELFHSSFFEHSPDTRFLVLVMAIEALMEPLDRSEAAKAHVEQIIELTKNAKSLSPQEKSSLLGSLKRLLQESISQTGRRLASRWLAGKTYMNKEAPAFFKHCYDIRSRLVHGNNKRPSRNEIANAAAILEVFVSDLLCSMLIQKHE